ncbi:hypothetical protein ACO2FM_02990 [Staphylococcus pasteuri]
MKRTIERILAWLGIITQLFVILILGVASLFGGRSEVQSEIKKTSERTSSF